MAWVLATVAACAVAGWGGYTVGIRTGAGRYQDILEAREEARLKHMEDRNKRTVRLTRIRFSR